MKKIGIALSLLLCLFAVSSCGSSKNDTLHLGVNAIITEIDTTNKIITVKDSGEEDLLGESCQIDCSNISMMYCNYDTQKVKSISFEDLQVNDEILLAIRNSEIESFQNNNEEKTIEVEQIQLNTQRIK